MSDFEQKIERVLKVDIDYRLNKTVSNDIFEFHNKEQRNIPEGTKSVVFSSQKRIKNINFEQNYTEFLNKYFLLSEGMFVAGGSLVSFLYNKEEKDEPGSTKNYILSLRTKNKM